MPAQLLHGALRQLLADVEWGELDVLVIDLPPGTADLQQQLFGLVDLGGALIVVGPQDVAHLDGRKVLDMLRSAGVRVIGGVENMAGLVCPHCGEVVEVFSRPEERSLWAAGSPAWDRCRSTRRSREPETKDGRSSSRCPRGGRDRLPRARRRGRRRARGCLTEVPGTMTL